jgi:hypothetical protein
MDFEAVIAAEGSGQKLRFALGVWFDFVSGGVGVWEGTRKLTLDWPGGGPPRTFLGAGKLGSIEGVEQAIDGAAPQMRFTLAGVSPKFAAEARVNKADYLNRFVTVFGLFFDRRWRLVGEPFVLAIGRMSGLSSETKETEDGFLRTVTLTAETPLGATKMRPPNSWGREVDQRRRFPDDEGFDHVAGIDAILIDWGPSGV